MIKCCRIIGEVRMVHKKLNRQGFIPPKVAGRISQLAGFQYNVPYQYSVDVAKEDGCDVSENSVVWIVGFE